jgi:serine/threonine-protein kinase
VYDCVEYQDHLYLVREFIEGETLSSWLDSLGSNAPAASPAGNCHSAEDSCPPDGVYPRVMAIAQDILAGLAYAHEHGLLHRYIHPKNILLADNQAKIMNFGLADHPKDNWSLDKVVYMSPEQLAQRPLSVRSDLYSFGVLLYTLLTKQTPFSADTVQELINQCTYATPSAPREINRAIPPTLERTILNLLDKDPMSRQPSAQAVLGELQEILDLGCIHSNKNKRSQKSGMEPKTSV